MAAGKWLQKGIPEPRGVWSLRELTVYEHFGCISAGAILKVEGHTLSGANFNSSQLQLQFIELISNHASIFGLHLSKMW